MKNYIRELRPVLDKQKKFMFFGNHKAGLTSIIRFRLRSRAINWKTYRKDYFKEFDKYSSNDIKKIFKFTVVRNPFDRTVSAFFYLKKLKILGRGQTFQEFIKNDFKRTGPSINIHFHPMFVNAEYVDFIGKLENIEKDWELIASKIKCSKILPKKNTTKHKSYYEYYDDECIEIVSNIYEEDIKKFGYKFKGQI